VRYDAALVERPADLGVELGSADALIVRNRTQVDAALLAGAPRLKVVGRLGVGLDNIDLPACEARRIDVIPATGANARSVAEYVIGAALLLRRQAYGASAAVAAGEWPRAALAQGRELRAGSVSSVSAASAAWSQSSRTGWVCTCSAMTRDCARFGVVGREHTARRPTGRSLRASDIVSLHAADRGDAPASGCADFR
jgi:hypothetical protein